MNEIYHIFIIIYIIATFVTGLAFTANIELSQTSWKQRIFLFLLAGPLWWAIWLTILPLAVVIAWICTRLEAFYNSLK